MLPVDYPLIQTAVEKIAPFLPIGTLPDGRRIVNVDDHGVMAKRTGMRPAGDPFPVMGWVSSYREDFAAGIVILANHAAELLATIEKQDRQWTLLEKCDPDAAASIMELIRLRDSEGITT